MVPEKQKQRATAVGSGDWLDSTVTTILTFGTSAAVLMVKSASASSEIIRVIFG